MTNIKWVAAYACFSVCTLASGCAATGEGVSTIAGVTGGLLDKIVGLSKTEIDASIEASDELNPDMNGRPSPVVIRLYELKSLSAFNRADFFSLYEDDTAVLGDEMQTRDELLLTPKERRALKRELKPGTRYLAVLAAYRDLEHAQWRATFEAPLNKTTPVIIELAHLSVSIVDAKE